LLSQLKSKKSVTSNIESKIEDYIFLKQKNRMQKNEHINEKKRTLYTIIWFTTSNTT